VERNSEIVKERMIQQMEETLRKGRKLIDTELDTGILNFIVRPVVKAFYDYWAQHDARKGTLKQIDITLDAGKQLLLNGNSEESFNRIVNEFFPKYLKGDQVTYQCREKLLSIILEKLKLSLVLKSMLMIIVISPEVHLRQKK